MTQKDLGSIRILEKNFNIQLDEIALIKGRIKNLRTGNFLEVTHVPIETKEKTNSKKRNKYPKGFTSNNHNPSNKQTVVAKKKPSKPPMDEFLSGTLSDALKLIEEAGLDD